MADSFEFVEDGFRGEPTLLAWIGMTDLRCSKGEESELSILVVGRETRRVLIVVDLADWY